MAEQEFLERLANQYFEFNQLGGQRVVYVFPTQRAGYYFSDRLKRSMTGTGWFPEIFSFHDFILKLSSFTVPPMPELIFQLYDVYRELVRSREIKFENFYTWGKMILSDFNEADKQMVDIEMLFQNLRDFGEIESLHAADQTDIYRRYVGFWGELGSLYHEFRLRLTTGSTGYDGMVYRDVAENIGNGTPGHWNRVLFCGLNALSMSEKKVIDYFINQSVGDVIWDMDRYFTDDDTQEAGHFYRENLRYFGADRMSDRVGSSLENSRNVHVVSVSSDAGQAKLVGELLKISDDGPGDYEDTAIVLPDESLLFPVLNSLPSSIKRINVTLGYPLKHSSLYNLFSLILEMHKNATPHGYFHQNVFDLLRHPYFKLILRELGEGWIGEIQQKNEIYIRDVPDMVPDLRKIFSEIPDSSSTLDLFLDLLCYLRDFNEGAGDDGGLFPMDLEFIHHFYILLNQMKEAFDKFNVLIEISSFWSLFSDIVADTRIPFTGEPLEGIQVMGMLETQALNFKRVFILSVNEGVLPAGKTGQSFIPYDIRKLVGLPTYHERDAVSAYHFFRLIKDAPEVHLIYNSRIKGIQKNEKSRYIDQLMYEWGVKSPGRKISQRICSFGIGSPVVPDLVVKKTPESINMIGNRVFSASSLLTYLTCSLKFYFSYVLRIRETEEMVESPDDRILGNIVHRILERCYAPYIGKKVTGDVLKKMDNESFFEPLIMETMKKELGISDIRTGRNRVVLEVIKAFMSHFFKFETSHSGFRVMGLEKNISTIAFKLENMGKDFPVELKGIVDRWDEKDGLYRIIDYKTGKVDSINIDSFDEFRGKRISRKRMVFQLLFYGYLFQKTSPAYPVSRLGIFGLRKPETPLGFLSIGKRSDITPEDFFEFERFLVDVFQEIYNPDIPFSRTPHEELCRNCSFQSQCDRIQRDFD